MVVVTIFVWAVRIFNLFTGDSSGNLERFWQLLVSSLFLLLAFAVLKVLVGPWREKNIKSSYLIPGFCIWTMTFWSLRGVGILFGEYEFGFKLVHTFISVTSISIAFVVNRLKKLQSKN